MRYFSTLSDKVVIAIAALVAVATLYLAAGALFGGSEKTAVPQKPAPSGPVFVTIGK